MTKDRTCKLDHHFSILNAEQYNFLKNSTPDNIKYKQFPINWKEFSLIYLGIGFYIGFMIFGLMVFSY